MRIIGLAGWSGAGKTTLLAKAIPRLVARGLAVSTVKHAHHAFDLDQPGKDSHTHRVAGATEVLVSSANRWALMHELRGAPELPLAALLGKLSPVDLVIVEGFKREGHPKLEVHRAEVGKPLLFPDDPAIVAIAADAPVPGARVPVVSLDDIEAIVDILLAHAARRCPARSPCCAPQKTDLLMAQLSDDCFAFSGPLMPVAEAERLIAERVVPVADVERVDLDAAQGRVVANDVIAGVDLPPFDNSAVDGYAVRHADLAPAGETRLAIVDRVTAGSAAQRSLGAGQAIRIFTGAPMPAGADTVFMQEDCRRDGEAVIVPAGLKRGANARLAGEDLRAGSVALPAGRRLGPQHLALAAALGFTALNVRRRVRVALFSTGDEIVEPGAARPAAALYDANRTLLAGMLERLGAAVTDLGILPDEPGKVAGAIAAAAEGHDLVLTSGGVSTGEADHVREAVEKVGRLVFWRVAIKPGRPVAMGVIPGASPEHAAAFVGLPGNPVAAFVTFARVVRPLLLRLAGAAPEPLIALPVRAAFAYGKKKGRREYVRVTLRRTADGAIEAEKYPQDGAGVLTSLTETDGLVELTEDITTIERGATVGFLPYSTLTG